jgi:hypothetical protein
MKLAVAYAIVLAKLHGDLDLETRSYMEHRQLHKLHEIVASSFDEGKA